MKHGGDRHVDAFAVKAALLGRHSERRKFADRVQHHLPMAEIDALRRSGRSAGVKGRGLRVLVEIGEVEIGRSRRQHVFIMPRDALFAQDERVVVRHDDDRPDLRQAGSDRREKRKEFVIDQEGRRACMFDRVDDLLMRQTNVHRLQDGAHHRDGEERFQKPVSVPVHHADGVAGAYAQFLQPARQTTDAVAQHAIGEALLIAVDDLLVRRMQHRRVKKVLDQQGILICGGGHLDESARHCFIPLFIVVATAASDGAGFL